MLFNWTIFLFIKKLPNENGNENLKYIIDSKIMKKVKKECRLLKLKLDKKKVKF